MELLDIVNVKTGLIALGLDLVVEALRALVRKVVEYRARLGGLE